MPGLAWILNLRPPPPQPKKNVERALTAVKTLFLPRYNTTQYQAVTAYAIKRLNRSARKRQAVEHKRVAQSEVTGRRRGGG